jgi:hypothetical protein
MSQQPESTADQFFPREITPSIFSAANSVTSDFTSSIPTARSLRELIRQTRQNVSILILFSQ